MIDDEKIHRPVFLSVPSKAYGNWIINMEQSATTSRITS